MDVKLVMFRADGSKRVFPILSGATTIGRKDDCTIRIPVNEVSRRHAEVFLDEDGPVVRDLGAANGTYLNSQRVTEDDLEAGDEIVVGPVVFIVQIDGKPTDGEMMKTRSKAAPAGTGKAKAAYSPDDEVDPIAALEALASSGDQTAITPEEDDEA